MPDVSDADRKAALVAELARAMCEQGLYDPDETMDNGGPRWKYYIPLVDAIMPVIARQRLAGMEQAAVIAERQKSTDTDWDASYWNQCADRVATAIRAAKEQ